LDQIFTLDPEEIEEGFEENSSKKSKEKGEEYIYVADNGDLHYVDENGNIFKCREERGEYLLEEQLYFSNNNNFKKKEEYDDEDDAEVFKKIRNDNKIEENKVKQPVYEEINFLKAPNYKIDSVFDKIHVLRKKV
jgi:hypothetical protein